MMPRIAARLLLVVLALHAISTAAGATLWWALDSGPLTSEPELVLAARSGHGAVRTFGDYPGLDPRTAARRTVDKLADAGGFDRSVLVVVIPTGSGWVDPVQVTATERWAGGDIATVAMRYSSAPSAAAYLLRPDLATRSASALLTEVTGRLRALDRDVRPQLVVHGLSLGARAGSAALADPAIESLVDSALWQGLPGGSTEAGRPHRSDRCTVSSMNADDPVTQLSWGLLRDPRRAVRVLTALPGSDSAAPGAGHRYRPILPPPGCVTPSPAR